MKTQLSNINNILSGVESIPVLLNEKFMLAQISSYKFSWSNIGHYMVPLLKQGFKEVMGSDVDLELLLLLVTGYLVSAKDAIIHNSFVQKMEDAVTINHYLPETV